MVCETGHWFIPVLLYLDVDHMGDPNLWFSLLVCSQELSQCQPTSTDSILTHLQDNANVLAHLMAHGPAPPPIKRLYISSLTHLWGKVRPQPPSLDLLPYAQCTNLSPLEGDSPSCLLNFYCQCHWGNPGRGSYYKSANETGDFEPCHFIRGHHVAACHQPRRAHYLVPPETPIFVHIWTMQLLPLVWAVRVI